MQRALALASLAQQEGEVPVGAVVVLAGVVIGEGWNRPIAASDPSAHAEILALRDAAQRMGNYRLTGASLYATLEPCPMCAGAMVHARLSRLIYGATDPLAGSAGSVFDIVRSPSLNHRLDVCPGVMAEECATQLRDFFKGRRLKSRGPSA